MRTGLALIAALVLGACAAPLTGPDGEDAAAAAQVVVDAIEGTYPDYTHTAEAAACVRDNATDDEILILSGRKGPRRAADLNRLAFAIASRPETRACIQANNIPPLVEE